MTAPCAGKGKRMTEIASLTPEFAEIRDYVQEHGEPYIGGCSLRATADSGVISCEQGCVIPLPNRVTDYHWLCREAMNHAGETGHDVAVSCSQQAVYGPYLYQPSP